MKISLFPRALVRICGESYDMQCRLNVSETGVIAMQVLQQELALQQISESINQMLFMVISDSDDDSFRKKLINVRRDLFNGRMHRVQQFMEKIGDRSGEEWYAGLNRYLETAEETRIMRHSLKMCYAKEWSDIESLLNKYIAESENLNRGLAFSSHALFDKLGSVNNGEVDNVKLTLAKMRYYSRITAKTSPFSSFTHLSLPIIIDELKGVKFIKSRSVTRFYVPNVGFLRSILKLLFQYKPFYSQQRLILNSTIEVEEYVYKFLINSNNSESIQRISKNDAVNYICHSLLEHNSLVFRELVNRMAGDLGCNKKEAGLYMLELIRVGMLEYAIALSPTDNNWLEKFCKVLEPLQTDRYIRGIYKLMQEMKQFGEELPGVNHPQVVQKLKVLHEKMYDIYLKLHKHCELAGNERDWMMVFQKDGNLHRSLKQDVEYNQFGHTRTAVLKLHAENIFFEDVRADDEMLVGRKCTEKLISKLNSLYDVLCRVAPQNRVQLFNEYYFTHRDQQRQLFSFLEFYEYYYSKRILYQTPDEDSDTPPYRQFRTRVLRYIGRLPLAEVVDLSLEELERLAADIDITPAKRYNQGKSNSMAVFTQLLFHKNEISGLIMNDCRYFNGNGKPFSRFVYMFDEKFLADLLESSKRNNQEGHMYVENCDFSYFNANMHPPLMPAQIQLSGMYRNIEPGAVSVRLSDLEVRVDEENRRLLLFHKTAKKQVYFFDLSFQSTKGRSGVFKLLQNFTGAPYLPNVFLITNIVNDRYDASYKNDAYIKFYPRIVVDAQIVLQRKHWAIDGRVLLRNGAVTEPHERYLLLKKLQAEWRLPDELFVSIDAQRINDEKIMLRYVNEDDHKPQYIHLNNLHLVEILFRLLNRYTFVILTEMYPGREHMLEDQYGHKHATEFVFQWTR